jgi:hypothetical protein
MGTPTETTKPIGRWWISPHGAEILKKAFPGYADLVAPRGMYVNDFLSRVLNSRPHLDLVGWSMVMDRCFHPVHGYIAWQEIEASGKEAKLPSR